MRLGYAVLLAVLVLGVSAAHQVWAQLQNSNTIVEGGSNLVTGADGAVCESLDFGVDFRRHTDVYILAEEGQTISGAFSVRGPPSHDIRFEVHTPHNRLAFSSGRKRRLDFSVVATVRGDYRLRFQNGYSIFSDKSVDLTYCVR